MKPQPVFSVEYQIAALDENGNQEIYDVTEILPDALY